MKLSIVMPAHNEETRIKRTLDAYSYYFNKLVKNKVLDYQILIVINASKDKTKEIVKNAKKKNKRVNYLDLKEPGKGNAVIVGFKESLNKGFDLIGFVDADMATPPRAFYDLVKSIGNNDGVIASRWIKGSIIHTKQTFLRRLTSRVFNFLVRSFFLMSYQDTQCGAKLFKAHVIRAVIDEIGITKWAFDVDLLYKIKRKHFKVIEVPTIWEDKTETKLNLVKVPFEMFSGILRLRVINSPFNFVIRFYDSLPEKIKIHHRLR